jgi:hypothetical protein
MGKAYTRVALVKEKISSFTFETVRGFFQRTLPIAEQDSGRNDRDVSLLFRYVGPTPDYAAPFPFVAR